MISFLIGLIDPVSRIVGKIAEARIAAANAQTDRERIAAEERVKGLEARADVLTKEAPFTRLNAIMRFLLALPVAVLLWKVFVYDKAFGQWTGGRTDALSPELWYVVMAVIGFFFLTERFKR